MIRRNRLKPAVPRRALFFLAASVWLVAGTVLLIRGGQSLTGHGLLTAGALAAGFVCFRFVFLRISERHIARIHNLEPERPCVFSFFDWRGYVLMALMISAGATLRISGLIPPAAHGVLSLIMGTPLLLSSIRFLRAGILPPLR